MNHIRAAEEAFCDPETSEFGRFGYNPGLAEHFLRQLKLYDEDFVGSSDIIELGAGSGKFTEQVLKASPNLALRWVAMEPVEAMRKMMAEKLCKQFPSLRVVKACAEDIPAPTGSACAVVCAQSFHWFANLTALREIHRILRPGGVLGFIWYMDDVSEDGLPTNHVRRGPNGPDEATSRFSRWRHVWDSEFASQVFSKLHERNMTVSSELDVETLVAGVISASPAVRDRIESSEIRKTVDTALRTILQQKFGHQTDSVNIPFRICIQWAYKFTS